ncbi:hypothetical protein WMF20_07600 [Sorangium sp. So ce834]
MQDDAGARWARRIRQRDASWFDIDETKFDGPDFYPGVLAGLV